jgi:hypothetical protein
MATYTITRISDQAPREWQNPKGGTVYYIKVMLEGHEKPVAIGKKKPDALSVGQQVHGAILENFDKPEDGFRPDPPSTQSTGNQSANFGSGGDDRGDDIRAQVALKAAVKALPLADATGDNDDYKQAVRNLAISFYGIMADVKGGSATKPAAQVAAPRDF